MSNLEQLEMILWIHAGGTQTHCSCGEYLAPEISPYLQRNHIAQAILDAGWTGPPNQDPPKTVLEILKEKLATTNTTHPADYHLTVLPGNPDRNEVTLRMETRAFDHPKPTWLDN